MTDLTKYSKVSADECNGVKEHSVSWVPPTAIKGDGSKSKKEEKAKAVGFFELFRFSDGFDKCLVILGLLCATVNGACWPIWVILFGDLINTFASTGAFMEYLYTISDFIQANNKSIVFYIKNPNEFNCSEIYEYYGGNNTCYANIAHNNTILDEMSRFAIYFCAVGAVAFIMSYGQVVCWMTAAERQAHRIRQALMSNVLRQDIGWFDTHAVAELNTRLSDDVQKIQEGIGDKVPTFWQWFTSSILSLACGFFYGWKLSLVILSGSPIMVITTALFGKLASTISNKSLAAYAQAGSVAEEVLRSIRTVVAFGGQEKAAKRYRTHLSVAEAAGIQKGIANGISLGLMWFVIFCMYGLSFWYGGKLYREDDDYGADNVVIVTFSVLLSAYSLGLATPSIEVISTGRGAAYTVFKLIDTKSAIDSSSEKGFKPDSVDGRLELVDVHFTYPARPEVKVLDGVSMVAKPGQTVALVGASGCGKSTIVQLLLRFYDSQKGRVMLDGLDIKDINVKWLRQNIGFVSQEPVLFATTIVENIRYGKEDATIDEIVEASKKANAAEFIMKLPDKFETLVGERGCQLSGGQKQRLAIARALVRDPKILLLDEATSALDTESESIVQDALDKAREGRTTVVIAHRLSTIKNADIIIGLKDGRVEEVGTHDELMSKQGYYYQLVMHQQADSSGEDLENKVTEEDRNGNLAIPNGKLSFDSATQKEEEDLPDAPFARLMKLNASQWPCIAIGSLASIISGAVWPTFGITFAYLLKIFTYEDLKRQEREVEMYALLFVAIAVASLISYVVQSYLFGRSGEALTKKLRDLSFQSMMRQDIAWFDDHRNNVGALTTRLATDASLVQGVIDHRMGSIVMNLSNAVVALVVSFIHGWQMTLLYIVLFPILSLAAMMSLKIVSGLSGKNKDALEKAGKVTVESIGNIRTVASLTIEPKFVDLYMANLEPPYRVALKNSHVVAFLFGLTQCVVFVTYAISFAFGAFMIEEGEMVFKDVFIVFSSVLFGFMGVGQTAALAPNIGKAQTSAKRILKIIDSEPTIDHTSEDGQKLKVDYEAEVTFKDVTFSYPTRETVSVLQGLTLTVSTGQTLAIVGTSGCGKSTAVQLIERFYDCQSGHVALSNQDVRSLNLKWLREQIGTVSQEPSLFNTSIAENIAYGDNTRNVPMSEIVIAARHANIHSFITSLPEGYETNVGSNGTQLSGGQKQRIAIARALVRNPKVLLLDEATSALDAENEKIVQEALDKAREGRTCIVIAHRMSTVKNADKICVISHGQIVETGNHSELMALQGIYYKLVKKSVKEA